MDMADPNGYDFVSLETICGGRWHGCRPASGEYPRQLLIDSRQPVSPAGGLFFAIRTRQNDGHRYIPDLLQKGLRRFVVEQVEEAWLADWPDAAFLCVDSPIQALQDLAAHHRAQFAIPVVGLTGSNGKTIIKEWLFQLLADDVRVVRNPKSYNSQIGVPLSVWQLHEKAGMAIFEAGISQRGEMERLQAVIQPTVGIFTNIGPAHDAGFSGMQEKIREKLRLFTHASLLIHCTDQNLLQEEIQGWHARHPHLQLLGWGRGRQAQVRLLETHTAEGQTQVRLQYQDSLYHFVLPFADEASLGNAMHCASYLLYLGMDAAVLAARMSRLQSVAMRLEMKEGINQSLLINDSYNSDLHSLAIALDFLSGQTRYVRSTLILSDIQQTGLPPPELYDRVREMIRLHRVDRLIGIGPDISSQAALFELPSSFYPDTDAFMQQADWSDFGQEVILLKGARAFGFERLLALLEHQEHQTLLEINLDALVHNLNAFRARLQPRVKTMAMVKAFSYGSGSVEVASSLQYHRVDYLAVAYPDEGKELRRGGINLPILVMNPEVQGFDTLFQYDLEPEVYGFGLLKRLIAAVQAHPDLGPSRPFPIHLKLDTGMHRLGFLPDEVERLQRQLAAHPFLKVVSVFSHLAASDKPQHDDFTREQIRLFSQCCDMLRQGLGCDFIRHLCNSSAIGRFPEAHFDMVRLGIGLYGFTGDEALRPLLRQVGTFKSVVSQLKHIGPGQSVGYDRAAVAQQGMDIAIVPVGYADGLDRRLGQGKGALWVNGHRAPIVGHISMDMCALDVTGLQVKEGDEVIVFGEDQPVEQLAEALGTIPYEVLTSVSHRVKRVYFQE